jgi:hypothetical protein
VYPGGKDSFRINDIKENIMAVANKIKDQANQVMDNTEHREGPIARGIEQQTAKLPSDLFLWGAVGAIGASAILQIMGRKETSNFVGQWVPTVLILGLYNKIVKVAGSDKVSGSI